MMTPTHSSICALHRRWAKLENEHHELARAIAEVEIGSADLASLRELQARLLLDIQAVTAEIRCASATTIGDIIALLDVVLDHETDLAYDIANHGPIDYPMITEILRAAAGFVPGFEFNSLRRWLSAAQFEQLFSRAENVAGPVECVGFGKRDESS
jgi:hypothetical protein